MKPRSGGLAERLRSGLQIRVDRFDSGTRLHTFQVFLSLVFETARISVCLVGRANVVRPCAAVVLARNLDHPLGPLRA